MEDPLPSSSSRSRSEADLLPASAWCHPEHKVHRFLALVLMCFLCFGSYFCYDTPGALVDNFKTDVQLSTSQFALLYSIYSWPNVILCFIGGYLIDRCFGVRLGTIIYMTIVFVGAVIFAFGVYINAFWLMILGRFIFGIGGESLQVAVNNYVVLWFKGKELNMVFGLQLSFSRFGSTVNFWVMEPVYSWVAQYYSGYERLGVTLFIATTTCMLSLLCALVMGFLDARAERYTPRGGAAGAEEEPFRLRDILRFTPVFWLVAFICVAYYLAIFPFIALGKLFFERKFNYSAQDANTVNSMVYLLSALLSPFFGILIDKTGRNVMWVIVSIVTTIGSHVVLAITFITPYVGVVSLGISYSLLAAGLWPLVALIIPENQLGTAYGICQAVQNLGLATVIILAGAIVDHYGYLMLEMFFLACLCLSLIAAVVIYIIDSAGDGVLNMSPSMRDSMKEPVARSEETANLLDNEVLSSDHDDEADSRLPEDNLESQSSWSNPQSQSDRIRSRYISQVIPNTNIPDRQ